MLRLLKIIDRRAISELLKPILVLISATIVITLSLAIQGSGKAALNLLFKMELFICCAYTANVILSFKYGGNIFRYIISQWKHIMSALPVTFFLLSGLISGLSWTILVFWLIMLLRSLIGLSLFTDYFKVSRLSRWLLIVTLSLYFASLAAYFIEGNINPYISNYYDALKWTLASLTTVGYETLLPVSAAGRMLAFVLAIGGMGFFAAATGYLCFRFLGLFGMHSYSASRTVKR